ncbi:class F sortase [Streptomyces sp. NPDC002265]|uniref:class F sortase n=1 Tax=Streptomyces sp. NPDC002265 TaxID=3154415 RepID=UPI00331EECEE
MTLAQQAPPDETPSRAPARHVGPALLWPAAAVALGALLIHHSLAPPADAKPPELPAVVAPPTPLHSVAPSGPPPSVAPPLPGPNAMARPSGPVLPRSEPKRIVIPQIGVNAPFTDVSLTPSGQLNTPPLTNKNLAGWYKGGASPGERGTSVVVGHVDTKTGAAIFVYLRFLKPGNTVDITRADGITARFKVDSVQAFSKAHFPNARVYADAPTAQLRLITCGGTYNRSTHEYESNVVVFAHLDTSGRS